MSDKLASAVKAIDLALAGMVDGRYLDDGDRITVATSLLALLLAKLPDDAERDRQTGIILATLRRAIDAYLTGDAGAIDAPDVRLH